MTHKHILSTNHYYYVKMISSGGIKKFIRVDMETPYHSLEELFNNMSSYVKDGICWKLLERNIYMCNCNINNHSINSIQTKYSRYTIWFVKLKNIENDQIIYMSTYNVKLFPVKSFKEVFNNITIPDGYKIDDYEHLYICNVSE